MKRIFVNFYRSNNHKTTTTTTNKDDDEQLPKQDRLSLLPDVLLIYILSFIDTKLAVQSSILSKRWVNLWTLLPILNFNSALFQPSNFHDSINSPSNHAFDMFVNNVLARRNHSIKIDAVNIEVTDYNTMSRVFDYAVRNPVANLSIDTSEYLTTKYRLIECGYSNDWMTSLKLKGMLEFGRFPVFNNLVSLRLERVKIVESEPFSSFPNLKELFLVNCKMCCEMNGLEVIGFQLVKLVISSCFYHPTPYRKLVVLAPKLVVFEFEGLIPMEFEAFELPVLETVCLDCCFSFPQVLDMNDDQPDNEEQKANLIKILWCVRNVKCMHLSPSTVQLLSLSQDKLVGELSPFVNLKVLNLIPPPNKPVSELLSSLVTYLLKGSPGVVVKALPR